MSRARKLSLIFFCPVNPGRQLSSKGNCHPPGHFHPLFAGQVVRSRFLPCPPGRPAPRGSLLGPKQRPTTITVAQLIWRPSKAEFSTKNTCGGFTPEMSIKLLKMSALCETMISTSPTLDGPRRQEIQLCGWKTVKYMR